MNGSFAYLSVLISIILGLAAAHLLGSVVGIINMRDRTILYWPSLLWSGILFRLIAQLWWADASLRSHTGWSFGAFLVLLAEHGRSIFSARSSCPHPTAQAPSTCARPSTGTARGF